MAAIAPRAIARAELDAPRHFALIDADLDENERRQDDLHDTLESIQHSANRQLWATVSLTVSLLTATIGLFLNLLMH